MKGKLKKSISLALSMLMVMVCSSTSIFAVGEKGEKGSVGSEDISGKAETCEAMADTSRSEDVVPRSPVKPRVVRRKKKVKMDSTAMKSEKPENEFKITLKDKDEVHLTRLGQKLEYIQQDSEDSLEENDLGIEGIIDGKKLEANEDLVNFNFESFKKFSKFSDGCRTVCFGEGTFLGYELVSFLSNDKIAKCEKKIDIFRENYKLKLTVYSPEKAKNIVFHITLGCLGHKTELEHICGREDLKEADFYDTEVSYYNEILEQILNKIENVKVFKSGVEIDKKKSLLFLSESNLPKGMTYVKGCCHYDDVENDFNFEDYEDFNDPGYAYRNALKTVKIKRGIREIGSNSLCYLTNVKKITIPSSVVCIAQQAFSESGFEEIIIEEGVKSIQFEAFEGCKNLKKVHIPASVLVDKYAFDGCNPNLKIIYGGKEYSVEEFKSLDKPFERKFDFGNNFLSLEQLFDALASNGVAFEFSDCCSLNNIANFNKHCENLRIYFRYGNEKLLPLNMKAISGLFEKIGVKFNYKSGLGVQVSCGKNMIDFYVFDHWSEHQRKLDLFESYLNDIGLAIYAQSGKPSYHFYNVMIQMRKISLGELFNQFFLLSSFK